MTGVRHLDPLYKGCQEEGMNAAAHTSSLLPFHLFQYPSSWDGDANIKGGSSPSIKPLGKHLHIRPEVCLLGDSESSQVDNED